MDKSTDTADLPRFDLVHSGRYTFNPHLPTFPFPPEVLRKIFVRLDTGFLLNSRFVSPQWNQEVCAVLTRRDRCLWKFKRYLDDDLFDKKSHKLSDIAVMLELPTEIVEQMNKHFLDNHKNSQTDSEIDDTALISESCNKSLFSSWSVASADLMEFHTFVSSCEMFPYLESLRISGSVIQIIDFINAAAFRFPVSEETIPIEKYIRNQGAGRTWALPNLKKLSVWGSAPSTREINELKTALRTEDEGGAGSQLKMRVVGFGDLISPQILTSLQLGGVICVDNPNFCLNFISGCSNLKSLLLSPSLRCQTDVERVETIFRGLLNFPRILNNLTEFGWSFRSDLNEDKTWPELLSIVFRYEFSYHLKSLRIGSSRLNLRDGGAQQLYDLLDVNLLSLQSLTFTGDVQTYEGPAAKTKTKETRIKSKIGKRQQRRNRNSGSSESPYLQSYDSPDYLSSSYSRSYLSKLSGEELSRARNTLSGFADALQQVIGHVHAHDPYNEQIASLNEEFQGVTLNPRRRNDPSTQNPRHEEPGVILLFESFPNLPNLKFLKIDSNRGYRLDIFRLLACSRALVEFEFNNPRVFHYGFPLPYFPVSSSLGNYPHRGLRRLSLTGQNIADFPTFNALISSAPCLEEFELVVGLDMPENITYPPCVITSLARVALRLRECLPYLKVLDLHYTFFLQGMDFQNAMKELAGIQSLQLLKITWRLKRLGPDIKTGIGHFANSQCQLIVFWEQIPDPDVVEVYRRFAAGLGIKLRVRASLNERKSSW